MTEKQIKEYEKLSKLKEQYKQFIETNGDISISYYSRTFWDISCVIVEDNEFKDLVKTLAKERLKIINQKIEEI